MKNTRKKKKLIHLEFDKNVLKERNSIHLDHKDTLLAKEHFGQYLITTLSKKSRKRTSRIYLAYKPHKEYFEHRKQKGESLQGVAAQPNKLHLLDRFPQHIEFIRNVITTAVPNIMSYHLTEDFLRGLGTCLLVFDHLKISLKSIDELTNKIQKKVIENISKVSKVKNDRNMLRYFFGTIEKYVEGFTAMDIPKTSSIDQSIEAYASSVIYQMDYYARKELKRLKKQHLEYKEWIKELDKKELFSLENLACTYHNPTQKNRAFKHQINRISKTLHNTDLKSWESQENGKFTYISEKQKQQHQNLLGISKKGIDIEIKDEKMFALWMKTIHPNWPFDQTVDEKFREIYTHDASFRHANLKKVNLNYHEFESRIYPGFHEIYPLILLLLIREGINSEVLQDWKVSKTTNGYKLGDQSPFAIIIDAEKTRSNSIITATISKDSEQAKYIEFYTQWLSDIYDKSDDNSFFQHTSVGSKILTWRSDTSFHHMSRNENSFYNKYKIFDIDGERILHVNHKKIRVSSNYIDYLRGLSEFERQLKKGHESIDTQKKYENSKEWYHQFMQKISKTQNQFVAFFRGQSLESTHRIEGLFEGPLCDCSDPTSPDYPGHKPLKSDEVCTDWFKCLTGCTKAIVIKHIHGPAIVAWIKYLKAQEKEFFRTEDWDKEYLHDLDAAKSALVGFNESQIKLATENAHHYKDLVKIKFAKKVKITEKTLERKISG